MERQQAIEARQEILMRLLTFAAPIELLEQDIRALSWDYPEEDIVLMTPTMAVVALDRAINGQMPVEDLFDGQNCWRHEKTLGWLAANRVIFANSFFRHPTQKSMTWTCLA